MWQVKGDVFGIQILTHFSAKYSGMTTSKYANKEGTGEMDFIAIQLQDLTGNWRTYSLTQNNSLLIIQSMRSLKEQFPECRIRAVDIDGRLVDIL